MLVSHLERIQRHQALVLEAEQDVPRPFVGAGLGGRRDDRARGLLIFRLVVLGDDAVLLDRASRERIAATSVLSYYAPYRLIVIQSRYVHYFYACIHSYHVT